MLRAGRTSSTIMSEFLRKYWFVCLIAIAMIGMLIYFIMDMNKDNVSGKTADGVDVVASTSLGDYTSDEMFDDYQGFNQSLLYYMYQDAVVNQSVETTDEISKEADSQAKTLKTNMESDSTNQTYFRLMQQLAGFGFEGDDAIRNYCVTSLKLQQLERAYITENADKYLSSVSSSPKEISILTVNVDSADAPSEEQKTKMDSVDKALESGSFEDAAKAFSEDAATAAENGYFGYADSNSSTLDQAIRDAIKDLKKGETSEWITVTNQQSGQVTQYRVYINETDFKTIFNSENETTARSALNALLSANPGLEVMTVKNAADKLGDKISFENEEVKKQVESYIETQTGGSSDEK